MDLGHSNTNPLIQTTAYIYPRLALKMAAATSADSKYYELYRRSRYAPRWSFGLVGLG